MLQHTFVHTTSVNILYMCNRQTNTYKYIRLHMHMHIHINIYMHIPFTCTHITHDKQQYSGHNTTPVNMTRHNMIRQNTSPHNTHVLFNLNATRMQCLVTKYSCEHLLFQHPLHNATEYPNYQTLTRLHEPCVSH